MVGRRVAVVELSSLNHSVMIYNWFHMCRENGWQFKLFTTKEIFNVVCEDIDLRESEVFIFERMSYFEFYRASKSLSLFDVAILTSLQSYFFHYLVLLLSKVKFVVTIHNLNAWFSIGSQVTFRGRVKAVIRSAWKKRSSAYVVNSQNMFDYASFNQFTTKNIEVIPFSLRQKSLEWLKNSDESSGFTIVYPGMVSLKRKNYDLFLRLAKDNPSISFVLLGKLVDNEGGQEVVKKIDSSGLLNVVTYDRYVSQEEFDTVMRRADLIFSSVNVDYCYDGVSEKYGETKDSGISYLMLEYALPLIVNSGFRNFKSLDVATLYYDDYDILFERIKALIKSRELYAEMQAKIVRARDDYDLSYYASKAELMIARCLI